MKLTIQTILSRSSVRSFDEKPLSSADTASLREAFTACSEGPFGNKARFVLVGPGIDGASGTVRLGTYGVIRKAPAYILGVIARGPFAFEDYGYCLHGVVLTATALGRGTCWLGGIFDRAAAVKAVQAAPNEIAPAMTPVGRPAARRGLVDSIIRGSAGASKRKPWEELFFSDDFSSPLARENDPWSTVLECVRRGPSASNKQPWRIIRTRDGEAPVFHLYLREDKAYNHMVGEIRLQNIDMGIAMRQFETAAQTLGLSGKGVRLEKDPFPVEEPFSYIASFVP